MPSTLPNQPASGPQAHACPGCEALAIELERLRESVAVLAAAESQTRKAVRLIMEGPQEPPPARERLERRGWSVVG